MATCAALFLIGCSSSSTSPGTAPVPDGNLRTNRSEPSPRSSIDAPTKTVVSQTAPGRSDPRSAESPSEAQRETVDASPTGDGRVAVRTDAHGRKWLGDVPYDVFFDDPLAVAAEGETKPRQTPNSASPTLESPTAGKATGGDATAGISQPNREVRGHPKGPLTQNANSVGTAAVNHDWPRLIDMEVIDAEVRRIRAELAAQLQSIGKYNSHYQEVAVDGAALAAMAQIAAEHSGTVSWKSQAPLIRDLAAKIHDGATAARSSAYQATKAPYDQLVDVLDGNIPAGLGASPPERDFAEVANRNGVMKRMDRAFQWLKKSGSAPSQQALRKEATMAVKESSLLAALGRVIVVGKYDSSDDEKYKTHAEELTRAAVAATAAVRAEDANAYRDAVSRIQKRCDACHAEFRFQ